MFRLIIGGQVKAGRRVGGDVREADALRAPIDHVW
jgi:hypothetical protein